jgi:glutathione synthase
MDPLGSLNLALDSSIRMMFELTRLGHETYAVEPKHLGWDSRKESAHAHCIPVSFGPSPTEFKPQPTESMSLKSFDAIHMRKDPPYDMDYITTTWMMDTAVGFARIYNHPNALRSLNEKLAIFLFPDAVRPGLVSADVPEMLAFLKSTCQGDGILKPLTLFGGRGIFRINLNQEDDDESATQKLTEATLDGRSPRLLQAFDSAIYQGEVRVFTAFGQPIAWCLKRPAEGQYLANTSAGATLESYTPTPEEENRVVAVAQSLMREGVALVGFDVIGGYISEINITSPRLLTPPNDQTNYYAQVAKLMAEDIET